MYMYIRVSVCLHHLSNIDNLEQQRSHSSIFINIKLNTYHNRPKNNIPTFRQLNFKPLVQKYFIW